jgi:hypothetical protein
MGRRTSRTNTRSKSPSTNLPKQTNIPTNTNTNIPKVNNLPNQQPGFLSSLAQGATMGAGMAIGNQMVNSVFSGNNSDPNNVIVEQPKLNDPKCLNESRQLEECLKNDLGNCHILFNYLQQCHSHYQNGRM